MSRDAGRPAGKGGPSESCGEAALDVDGIARQLVECAARALLFAALSGVEPPSVDRALRAAVRQGAVGAPS